MCKSLNSKANSNISGKTFVSVKMVLEYFIPGVGRKRRNKMLLNIEQGPPEEHCFKVSHRNNNTVGCLHVKELSYTKL